MSSPVCLSFSDMTKATYGLMSPAYSHRADAVRYFVKQTPSALTDGNFFIDCLLGGQELSKDLNKLLVQMVDETAVFLQMYMSNGTYMVDRMYLERCAAYLNALGLGFKFAWSAVNERKVEAVSVDAGDMALQTASLKQQKQEETEKSSEVALLEQIVEKLQYDLSVAEEQVVHYKELYESVEQERDELEDEVEERRHGLVMNQERVDELYKRVDRLNDELKSAFKNFVSKNIEIENLEDENADLKQTLQRTGYELSITQEKVVNYREHYECSERVCEALRNEMEEMRLGLSMNQRAVVDLGEENEKLEERVQELNAKFIAYRDDLRKKCGFLVLKNLDIDRLENEIADLKKTLERTGYELANTQEMVVNYKEDLELAQEECAELKERCKTMQLYC